MSKNFEFMQKVYIDTTVNGVWVEGLECLFIYLTLLRPQTLSNKILITNKNHNNEITN